MSPSHLPETPIFVKARGLRGRETKRGKDISFPLLRTPLLAYDLDIVIEGEFVRVRTETKGIEFFGPLPVDPGFDDVFGEDITFE